MSHDDDHHAGAALYPPPLNGDASSPPLPSTERQGRRTACVALSATGAAVLIGVIVSLAVGPGVAEGGGVAAAGAASSSPPPRVAALSNDNTKNNNRWFDCPPGLAAAPQQQEQQQVSFLVLGDWGRQGNANQRRVSDAMADVASCLKPAYVVSTGDNFYPEGLFSPDDDQFQRSFSSVYGSEGGGDPQGRAVLARLPFYAALGNHDTTEGRQGALRLHGRYSLTPVLEASAKNGALAAGRWHCYNGTWTVPDASRGVAVGGGASLAGLPVSFGVLGGNNTAASTTQSRPLLDLIVIDTNAFMDYNGDSWSSGEREANAASVREGLERRLRASRAIWRVVVGHHPVHSLGEHCRGDPNSADCGQMSWLGPVLREHGVSAYLAGHEHDLQLIFETEEGKEGKKKSDRWPAFVVSGGGSNIRSNEFRTLENGREEPNKQPPNGYSAPFVADQQGFVAAVVNETALALHYYTLGHRLPAHTTVLRRRQ
jgi:hypothetical protein